MNTDVITDEESDDFTDEEEQQTPTLTRQSSFHEKELYGSAERQSTPSNSEWYTDIPKNDYLEAEIPNGNRKLDLNKNDRFDCFSL